MNFFDIHAWILPLLFTFGTVAVIYFVREKIPKRAGELFGPAGGGINALYGLLLGGAVVTGSAGMVPWIFVFAVFAQLFSVIADFKLKAGIYPKLAGSIAMVWNFMVFFSLLGITVTGLTVPPEFGAIIPVSKAFAIEKFVLPVLITAVLLLLLKIAKVPDMVVSGFSVTASILYPMYWFLSSWGATTGDVIIPLNIALIAPLGMSVRSIYDIGVEARKLLEEKRTSGAYSIIFGTSMILALTWFQAFWFAEINFK